jgi:hypothetical protein
MTFAQVRVKPDTLDEENRKFVQSPLSKPLFLNSVPKSGSHLLRNIIRMFVPVESQYNIEFIQHQFLQFNLGAFDPGKKQLSWGHLLFTDVTAAPLAGVTQILLVRDPYDWVLAQARFLTSDEFEMNLGFLKDGSLSVDAILNLMIFGINQKISPLGSTYTYNAIAWLGTGAYLVRYEDLIDALRNLDEQKGDRFFSDLLEACNIAKPEDWRERIRVGSDRNQSGTARENLTGVAADIPDELPDLQKRMVDFAAPGLRSMLGYQ